MTDKRESQQDLEIYKTKNLFFKPLIVRTEGGKLNVGENNVFHVSVYLMSEGGPITIGNYNIFEDKVVILNKSKTEPMEIGNFNYFKEGARIQSTNIGNFNEFGINCHVQKCSVGNGNIIGAFARLKPSNQKLKSKTIAQNGLVQENKMHDDNYQKKVIFYKIKSMHKVYK